jgi:hypothetical protein
MIHHGHREEGNATLLAPGNPILKNDDSGVASSIRFRDMLQFQAILRTGFLANSAEVTQIVSKKELIGAISCALKNG